MAALGGNAETTTPGTIALARVFAAANAPVLLLFDEVLNFVKRLRGMAERLHAFIQNLTVAVIGSTLSLVRFPEASAADQDSPRLALIVLDPGTEGRRASGRADWRLDQEAGNVVTQVNMRRNMATRSSFSTSSGSRPSGAKCITSFLISLTWSKLRMKVARSTRNPNLSHRSWFARSRQ